MRYLLRALLLALPLLAVPARAEANGDTACSIASCICCKFRNCFYPCCYTDWGAMGCCGAPGCGGCGGGCGGGAGPWYTYWPYNAHFAVPAHPEYPFWPAPMAPLMNGPQMPAAYGPAGAGYVQPVSYPRYWYGY